MKNSTYPHIRFKSYNTAINRTILQHLANKVNDGQIQIFQKCKPLPKRRLSFQSFFKHQLPKHSQLQNSSITMFLRTSHLYVEFRESTIKISTMFFTPPSPSPPTPNPYNILIYLLGRYVLGTVTDRSMFQPSSALWWKEIVDHCYKPSPVMLQKKNYCFHGQ